MYLNSGSKLRFSVSFSELQERKVHFSGEGYFVVNSDPDSFIAETGDLQMRATGTSFKANAYKNNKAVKLF